MLGVIVGNSFESALVDFKKQVSRLGILRELKVRRDCVTRSARRKEKDRKAGARRRKNARSYKVYQMRKEERG